MSEWAKVGMNPRTRAVRKTRYEYVFFSRVLVVER